VTNGAHMTCDDLFIAPHNKQNFYSKINSIYKSTVLYLRNIKLVLFVCFYKFEIENVNMCKLLFLQPAFNCL